MKITILTLLFLIVFQTMVSAETLKGGYPACVSEELFDQMISAIDKKDKKGINHLLENGCFIAKSGTPISVLYTTSTGKAKVTKKAKVRAYAWGDTFIIWTDMENIRK